MRFNEFVNRMRINYISENFGNVDWDKLTLEGIAKQVGFTSRTTFFNAIKKLQDLRLQHLLHELKAPLEVLCSMPAMPV